MELPLLSTTLTVRNGVGVGVGVGEEEEEGLGRHVAPSVASR